MASLVPHSVPHFAGDTDPETAGIGSLGAAVYTRHRSVAVPRAVIHKGSTSCGLPYLAGLSPLFRTEPTAQTLGPIRGTAAHQTALRGAPAMPEGPLIGEALLTNRAVGMRSLVHRLTRSAAVAPDHRAFQPPDAPTSTDTAARASRPSRPS